MIAFPCPKCQTILKAPEEKGGARTSCPKCGSAVQVPHPSPAANGLPDWLMDVQRTQPTLSPAVAPIPPTAATLSCNPPADAALPQRPGRVVIWVGAAVAAAGLLWMCAGGGVVAFMLLTSGLHPASTPAPLASDRPKDAGKTPSPNAQPVKVAVNELWNAYTANLAAGDVKYAGKLVEISGVPAEIKKDDAGRHYLEACYSHLIQTNRPERPAPENVHSTSLEQIISDAASASILAGNDASVQYLPGVKLYIDEG